MKPPSIKNYLSGVKMLHIFLGFEYTHADDYYLKLLLRGISRLHPHCPQRAKPITPAILLALHHHMDHSSSLHSTVFACSLILFYTMARLGSILPSSGRTPKHTFLTGDRINSSKEGLLVTLIHTKTIQFGDRRLHIPLLKSESVLCPFRAYHSCLSFLGSNPFVPAFVFVQDNHIRWLTRSIFINTFRDVMRSAGIPEASSYTGHSFRRGGASWAFQAGVPGELIQICGDWVSDAYKLDLEFNMENKLDLAALFALFTLVISDILSILIYCQFFTSTPLFGRVWRFLCTRSSLSFMDLSYLQIFWASFPTIKRELLFLAKQRCFFLQSYVLDHRSYLCLPCLSVLYTSF